MKLEDKCERYIIKRLLNVYCEIFGTRSYGGDALASSCVLRHMNSCRIFHNIHSITYNYILHAILIPPNVVLCCVALCNVMLCYDSKLSATARTKKRNENLQYINIIL